MLIQYSVENYKSIKDEITINFSAGKKYCNEPGIYKNEKVAPFYKCLGLIGPNASGKTNIIRSFLFAVRFIINTIERKDNAKIKIDRFRFDKANLEKPATFEFIFYHEEVKYIYGFSLNEKEIVEEYLMGYFTAKPKTWFERLEGQHYEFKGNDVKIQREIAKKTNKNRLYMPVAAEWGYEPLKVVYEWFHLIARQYENFDISGMIEQIIQNEKQKKMFISELKNADFDIADIYVKKQKIDQRAYDFVKRIVAEFVGEADEDMLPDVRPIVHLVHQNNKGESLDIAIDEDSAGTSKIVQNIAELFYLRGEGGVILEDELGKTYHTKLTQHFLKLFMSDNINSGNVQLLFTSHDTKLLNLLNPDQIYLVDKNDEGATYVKLLDDFQIRESENIELGYLKGRYGSIPYMRGEK